MVYLYISLVAANLIIGFRDKKSKILSFLSYFIIILLMSLNTAGPDIGNYLYDYNLHKNQQVLIAETGYNTIRYFFSNILNLDFFAFHLIITIICLALIRSTISYVGVNENCIIGLFMSYLFFIDTIQIRNFVLEAVLIYAVRFLFSERKFNTLKYIVCIFIAYCFHKIALVYLLLLVCKLRHRKPLINLCFIISIIAFLFFMFSRESLNSIIIFVTELLGLKSSYSFTATRFSFIPIVVLYFAEFLALKIFKSRIKEGLLNSKEVKYLDLIKEIQMILVISLPLLLINMNFYRIIRNVLILKYIAFAIYLKRIPKNSNLWWELIAFIVLSIVGWFVSDYMLINKFEIIAEPILTGNLIFDNKVNEITYTLAFKMIIIFIVSLLFSISNKTDLKIKGQKLFPKKL